MVRVMPKIWKTAVLCVIAIPFILLQACQEKRTDANPSVQSEEPQASLNTVSSSLKNTPGKIVFQSDRDGDWEIYVMEIDGSNFVQLTDNSAADEYPVWSPDGQQIAFKSNRDGGNFDIYVMNADGTNQRQVTNHPANDEDPAWSPDGKMLAFHSDRESGLELYLIKPDGSDLTPLTRTIGRNGLPAWSPDGTRMAYTGNRYLGWNVYVMNLDKTDDNRITDGHGACRPDWSPDGKKLAYVSGEDTKKTNIWVMNPDGSERWKLTNDNENYDYYPAWSPDGKYLVYAKSPDKQHGNWELYLISADGTKQIRLTNHPANDKFPDWYGGGISDDVFDKLASRQKFIYEAELSPRIIGTPTEDQDASNIQAVYTDKSDNAGFLMYGPYASYPPGNYVASFRLKVDKTPKKKPIIAIDVAADGGKTILARKELQKKDFLKNKHYQEFQLLYALQGTKTLEFRVYSFGVARIWVDKVTVQSQPTQ
jgi:Tol biopolymer transport system component